MQCFKNHKNVKTNERPVMGQLEMAGARTVPVRSGRQRRNLENSPVAFIVEPAADGDRPRSSQTDPPPNVRKSVSRF
jgi:hypothetical protein